MATPRYITLEEARLHVKLEAYKGDQKAEMNEAIKDATETVDSWTGTWWDKRHVRITTEAVEVGQRSLFMPARIISIDSITVDGVALLAADFKLFGSWIRYTDGRSWTRKAQAIVVEGQFGHVTTPGDIKRLTKELSGAFSGFKTKTYMTSDGVQATVSNTSIPDWADTTVETRAWRPQIDQVFKVETL